MNRALTVSALLILFASPVLAQPVCEGVGVDCELLDLGGGEYEFVFTLVNGSAESNAVWFWVVTTPAVSSQWQTILFDLPEGWSANHPDMSLHFSATDNGDGNPYRIYSASASGCGNTMGVFRWRFFNAGGPTPMCNFMPDVDYLFHMQGVDPMMCFNVGQSFTCPGIIPVEEMTWSSIKALYR